MEKISKIGSNENKIKLLEWLQSMKAQEKERQNILVSLKREIHSLSSNNIKGK